MNLRYAPITVAVIVLLLLSSGCDVLKKNIATSGPKRYKSEIAAVSEDIKEQLDNDGKVNPTTAAKFSGIVDKYQKDFGTMNSWHKLDECRKEIALMDSDSGNSFTHKTNAEYALAEALKTLETEVPEG